MHRPGWASPGSLPVTRNGNVARAIICREKQNARKRRVSENTSVSSGCLLPHRRSPGTLPFLGKLGFFCPTEGLRQIGTNHKHLGSVKKISRVGEDLLKAWEEGKCMSSDFLPTHSFREYSCVQSFNLGWWESFRNGYGDGCRAQWVQLMPLYCTLQMVKRMKFILRIFYDKNKFLNKIYYVIHLAQYS